MISSTPIYAIWDDHDAAIDDVWLGPYVDKPSWKMPLFNVFKNNSLNINVSDVIYLVLKKSKWQDVGKKIYNDYFNKI